MRDNLLGIPSDIGSLERNYVLADEDLDLVATRRRPENRLGLAVHIALLRHPGQGWLDGLEPPTLLVAWLAEQVDVSSEALARYAARGPTRSEHRRVAIRHLGLRAFLRAEHMRAAILLAARAAFDTDDGGAILRRLTQREACETSVIERLVAEQFASVSLDFDGSVLSTGRHAEGTAVGFNKKKKGARSYYPLFCTVAQTDQVLDVHHRPGNVHDSNGADTFIEHCVRTVRESLPRAKIEVRIDSAFFNQGIVGRLHSLGVTFTVSVPFERFAELKEMVERRQRWRPMAGGLEYFESRWKPKSWNTRYRFLFIRKHVRRQNKFPIQLDLFQPIEYGYEFKVVVTNKKINPRKVVLFHEGRGSQEGIFAELKMHCQMGYVPVKTRVGNQLYMFAGILAHNLTRELQMRLNPRERRTTAKRAALWCFREVETLRRTLIQRTGRIIRPAGKLILSMNSNARLEGELRHALAALNAGA